jgi:hypothetical protein
MLRTTLQYAACTLVFVVFAGVTSAAGVYQDPAGEFRTPLPHGWTVERQAMSKEVCEGTATDIRSGRDPVTQLSVRTCPVDLNPASLRESYYRGNPQTRAQDESLQKDLAASTQEMIRALQPLSDQLRAENRTLRQQIDNPETTPRARQAAQANLQKNEATLAQLGETQAESMSERLPATDDPAHATQLRSRLLEETGRPFFTGYMKALREGGRVETSGKVSRTTALGRDAMRSDFVLYPKKDGKPRKGFMVYLLGHRTSYFFAVMGDEQEYPTVAQMFDATEILR